MSASKSSQEDPDPTWRICLECGNRFEIPSSNANARWCSYRCQAAIYRTGRDQVASWAHRARWWLR